MNRTYGAFAVCFLLSVSVSATENDHEQTQSVKATGTAEIYTFSGWTTEAGLRMPEKKDPVEMAYNFFELNREASHMVNPREELRVERNVTGAKGARHLSFKQVHNGIPIEHSHIQVHFDNKGNLKQVVGGYAYGLDLSTTPQVDSAAAESLVMNDLAPAEHAEIRNSEQYSTGLTIWRDNDGKFRLIWIVWAKAYSPPRPYFWQYYVDAHDGTILQRRDQIRYNVPQSNH